MENETTILIIHYFFIFVKLKKQDLQDMSRIFMICKISRIRETGLQVRKDLNVYRLRPYRRARACPSPPSVAQKILLRLQVRKDLNVYRCSAVTRRKGP